MRSTTVLLALAASLAHATSSLDKKASADIEPCTVTSTITGTFYDLKSLARFLPEKSDKPADSKKQVTASWHARGYDYGSNFTLNVCAPVVEELDHVVGVDKDLWRNVSAFYELDGKTYSLGYQRANLTLRGPRLVLQYEDGSPCGPERKRDEDGSRQRRKSSTISFHCEKDPTLTTALVSYVGTDPDQCNYMFEVRSQAACGGAQPAKQGVGPGAVFTIMGVIAILVYFLGGIFYQRNVAHARGWRQLPNYSMWAGVGSFLKDMFIIATSSCARFMPSRRGYSALSVSANGTSSGRSRGSEDENRLIDSLDDDWDN